MLEGFEPTRTARVLIDGANDLLFDYAVPDHFPQDLIGFRVTVPLRQRLTSGTVISLSSKNEEAPSGSLRAIHSLIDPLPIITPNLMKLAHWLADYYCSPLEQVMRVLLPESVRQNKHQEKFEKWVELQAPISEQEIQKREKRAPKQASFLRLLQQKGPRLALKDLGADGALAVAKSLEKQNIVRLLEVPVRRDPESEEQYVASSALQLNAEQDTALHQIKSAFHQATKKPTLLHGVTGSGKTEVYLQAAEFCLSLGKSVMVLVPEISLAPQTVQRFKSRFSHGDHEVAILHSHLTQGERFDEWHRIRNGKARIVIGARSAIFAPLPDLGLIIVDEEHEGSYKQESSPRYHGRDIAVLRGHFENALVLLGSATPSLETYANTLNGKYDLISLNCRADHQSMPLIRVVDMRLESRKHKDGIAIFSDRLRSAIDARLDKGEQTILFLNRRGFARSLQCGSCGHVCPCQHCAIPLTYHRTEERLICHLCGFQSIVPPKCPECQDPGIQFQGYGTQKVDELLKKVFPKARCARLDADTSRKKNALKDILRDFKSHKIDILLGTQMIAKGLHFPNVTLVGILNADLGLHVPDFRASERTFSLLTQVAGRAGRGEMEGEVFIQTFTPHAPAVQFARHHDFLGFAQQELEFREQFLFPPYTHMVMLGTRSTKERLAEFTLENLVKRLREKASSDIQISDALPSPLIRAHGQFRFQCTLKSSQSRKISRLIQLVLSQTPAPEEVQIVVDVDAYSFM